MILKGRIAGFALFSIQPYLEFHLQEFVVKLQGWQ